MSEQKHHRSLSGHLKTRTPLETPGKLVRKVQWLSTCYLCRGRAACAQEVERVVHLWEGRWFDLCWSILGQDTEPRLKCMCERLSTEILYAVLVRKPDIAPDEQAGGSYQLINVKWSKRKQRPSRHETTAQNIVPLNINFGSQYLFVSSNDGWTLRPADPQSQETLWPENMGNLTKFHFLCPCWF